MSTCHAALTQRERPLALIEPFYPKGGNSEEGGRPTVPQQRMLRIDLGRAPTPDETAACSFMRTPGLGVV